MAEQIGHNVVDLSKSTSGSPLVDVAEHQTNTTTGLDGSATLDKNASDTVSTSQSGQLGIASSDDAAKPSAGNTALGGGSNQPSSTAALTDKGLAAHGLHFNGIRDDVSQGDAAADDRSTADVSVDASANSDTDNSRADALERKDGANHMRTNSVKKPATFSKVSVTKNFLAKTAASPVAATTKLNDKGKSSQGVCVCFKGKAADLSPASPVSAAAQLLARPRLVAKTGASLQNIQKARGAEGAGGPDASKVWNKNQREFHASIF